MAWRGGSLSRSLLSGARASALRSSSPSSLPGLRPSPSPLLHVPGQTAPSRRLVSSNLLLRNSGILGCTQSLLPLHSVVAASRLTSHIAVEARACCELSQGT